MKNWQEMGIADTHKNIVPLAANNQGSANKQTMLTMIIGLGMCINKVHLCAFHTHR